MAVTDPLQTHRTSISSARLPLACLAMFTSLALSAAERPDKALLISFNESAPKDLFVIQNNTQCELGGSQLTIELNESAGQLYFDTTAAGAGVEVYQPFEVVSGDVGLYQAERVADGQTRLALDLNQLAQDQRLVFSIDVDDQVESHRSRMTMITGSEIAGAQVWLSQPGVAPVSANFGTDSTASLLLPGC